MTNQKPVRVTFLNSEDGETFEMHIEGIKGKACQKVADGLKDIGTLQTEKETLEYRQAETVVQQINKATLR